MIPKNLEKTLKKNVPACPDISISELRLIRREFSLQKINVNPLYESSKEKKLFYKRNSNFYQTSENLSKSLITLNISATPKINKKSSHNTRLSLQGNPIISKSMNSSFFSNKLQISSASKIKHSEQEPVFTKPKQTRSETQLISNLYNKEPPEDPFYYKNIAKNINFSEFKLLLDEYPENFSLAYPYDSKRIKVVFKPKPFSKQQLNPKLSMMNCKCLSKTSDFPESQSDKIRESLPLLKEVKKLIQTLYRVFFSPQKNLCKKNIVIVIFDKTFAVFKESFIKKTETWKVIHKISVYFKLVIVLYDKRLKDFILKATKKRNIQISGMYIVNERPDIPKRCSKFIDYSQIYYDYEVSSLLSNCLIISTHSLYESQDNIEDFVFDPARSLTRLLVSGVPVASYEFWETPCCLAVGGVEKEKNCEVFFRFLEDIERDFDLYGFDFLLFFKRFRYRVLETSRAHHLFMDYIDGSVLEKKEGSCSEVTYCGIHCRYYKTYKYNRPANFFVVI